jgi:Spy/CpxP family protein refolding chaperone
MKLTKLIPITLCLATFLAGTQLVGGQTPDSAPPFCHKGAPDMTGMLTHMLQLTEAQKSQVEPFVAAARPQLTAIHEKARADADVVLKQLHGQIRPLLTPEQQKRLDAMEVLHGAGLHGPE